MVEERISAGQGTRWSSSPDGRPVAGQGRPVALLRFDRCAHLAASGWARAAAAALDTSLVSLRVFPPSPVHANVVFPQRNVVEGFLEARQVETLMVAEQRWHARFGKHETPPALVTLMSMGFQHLVEVLECVSPSLVVLPASRSWPAENVVRLATALQIPVLVCRGSRGSRRMVVASNLEDSRRPVLRLAAQWASVLGQQITLVHNITPMLMVPPPSPEVCWFGVGTAELDQQVAQHRVSLLERSAMEFGVDASVMRELDPAAGILGVASRMDASLVVVGARSVGGAASHRVPRRVLSSARRSVLVVPIDDGLASQAPDTGPGLRN